MVSHVSGLESVLGGQALGEAVHLRLQPAAAGGRPSPVGVRDEAFRGPCRARFKCLLLANCCESQVRYVGTGQDADDPVHHLVHICGL